VYAKITEDQKKFIFISIIKRAGTRSLQLHENLRPICNVLKVNYIITFFWKLILLDGSG
jgi:hypothetical protein